MIFVKGNKSVVNVIAHSKTIAVIYQGSVLLWQAVRSCFGSGIWVPSKPWLGAEAWQRTKKY